MNDEPINVKVVDLDEVAAAEEIARDSNDTDEAAERQRKYKEEREAQEARIKPTAKQVALLLNTNLGKLAYSGKKLSGAWAASDGGIIITTAHGDYIHVSLVAQDFYSWQVYPAILNHAKELGHDPSDWVWTHDIGKVSACNKCDAMARIVDKDGIEEVVAPAYMSACKGKR